MVLWQYDVPEYVSAFAITPLLLTGLEYENALFGGCFATEDQREGMVAFLERRKPNFKNTL